MRRKPTWLVPMILMLGCAGTGSPETTEASLLEADRAFARATAERGIDGWMSFFTADAVRLDLRGKLVRGLAEIREHDLPVHEDPNLELQWEPTGAGLFEGGDHGFTRGRYELVQREGGARSLLSRGTYLTIWRREEGGWKVILDTGIPDPPSAERESRDPAG
jgi:ketosteroid isomerase-like protein